MITRTSVLLLFVLLLAACSSAEPTTALLESGAEATVLELPAEVDVHTVASIKDRPDVYLLDVREQWEYDEAHLPGVNLLPMGEVPANLDKIPTDKEVIVTCRSGNRSSQITEFLKQNGFSNVHNMQGGILAWEQAGYEVVR
jgi:rhodanese-related sulfurtransferase